MAKTNRSLGLRSFPDNVMPQYSNWVTELRKVTGNDISVESLPASAGIDLRASSLNPGGRFGNSTITLLVDLIGTAATISLYAREFGGDSNPQIETAVVAENTPGTLTAGNAAVTITSALWGSPLVLAVAVALNDSAATVAGKIRTALAANAQVSAAFIVGGSTTAVVLTAIDATSYDSTLNIAIADGTCVGLTTVSSTHTNKGGPRHYLVRRDSLTNTSSKTLVYSNLPPLLYIPMITGLTGTSVELAGGGTF